MGKLKGTVARNKPHQVLILPLRFSRLPDIAPPSTPPSIPTCPKHINAHSAVTLALRRHAPRARSSYARSSCREHRPRKILSDRYSICCSDTSEAIHRARPHLDYRRSCPVEIDLHDIGGIMGQSVVQKPLCANSGWLCLKQLDRLWQVHIQPAYILPEHVCSLLGISTGKLDIS